MQEYDFNFPKYVVRPDDHAIFSLNRDGRTYTPHMSKIQFPSHIHNKYELSLLNDLGFYSSTEENLKYHRAKQIEYHENLKRLFDEEKDVDIKMTNEFIESYINGEQMYYLVKFYKDWADEFSVYGFNILKQEEWDQLAKELKERKKEQAGTWYFGTNEGWDDDTIGDFYDALEPILITEKEKELFIKLFGREEFGIFPDFEQILNSEEYREEEEEDNEDDC